MSPSFSCPFPVVRAPCSRLADRLPQDAKLYHFGSHPVPVVRVRWVETLGDAQRTAIEQSLGLSDAEHSAGSTWRYRVSDISPDRFDTILAHDMVTDAYGVDRAAYARFGPVINVRWVENLEDGQRTTLEHALRLYRAEHRGGSTWRYQVPDASPERLRTIVAHDLVTDTDGFDRGSLELDAPAGDISQFTDYRPIYASSWHPAESDPTAPESTWRWTQRIATLSFANPNADAAFYLDYSARPDLSADTPQTVTVRAGDQVLQSFPADAAGAASSPCSPPRDATGHWGHNRNSDRRGPDVRAGNPSPRENATDVNWGFRSITHSSYSA